MTTRTAHTPTCEKSTAWTNIAGDPVYTGDLDCTCGAELVLFGIFDRIEETFVEAFEAQREAVERAKSLNDEAVNSYSRPLGWEDSMERYAVDQLPQPYPSWADDHRSAQAGVVVTATLPRQRMDRDIRLAHCDRCGQTTFCVPLLRAGETGVVCADCLPCVRSDRGSR